MDASLGSEGPVSECCAHFWVVTGDFGLCWKCWYIFVVFFLYTVYELLIGLAVVTNPEMDAVIRGKIQIAQTMTVISWCTYPVVYPFPIGETGNAKIVF